MARAEYKSPPALPSDETRLFQRAAPTPRPSLPSASQAAPMLVGVEGAEHPLPAQAAHFIFSTIQRLAMQQSLHDAENVLCRSMLDLSASDRGFCLFYRPETQGVWSLRSATQSSEMSPGPSLALMAAHAGSGFSLERAGSAPEYNPGVDDPFGTGQERLLLQPLVAMGRVIAVLVMVRRPEAPPYQQQDRILIARLASESAAIVVHFFTQMMRAQNAQGPSVKPSIFRQEALDNRDADSSLGEVVDLRQRWLSWAYRLLLAATLLALLLSAIVPIHQYATGTSVVRTEGTAVRAQFAGTVERSFVVSGEKVVKGQLLLEYSSTEQSASFAEIDQQYQQQLVALLEEPGDKSARLALREIVARREQAKQRLEALRLRASRAGVVSDLRVQPGQLIAEGQPLLTLVDDDALPSVVALLPGNYRPQLAKGMMLRVRLAGYDRAEQEAEIEWISSEVVGPAEARRFLGTELADVIPVPGPVVLVRARLSTTEFEVDDAPYHFHNGMYGEAEVRIGSATLLSSIFSKGKQ